MLSRARPPRGRHRQREPEHERDLRAPEAARANGARATTRTAWSTRCASSLTEIPGVRYNFSQPIKDNVEEAVAGVRGKVVLKIFGTDLEGDARHAGAGATAARARCRASSTSACIATRPCRSCRSGSTARRWRAPASRSRRANDFIDTALAGKVTTTFWEGERPVPVRLMLPAAARENDLAIGELAVPRPGGGSVPLRELGADRRRRRRRQHQPRSEQPLPRAQVQRRGPRHGLGGDGRHRRRRATASRCPTATTSPGAASSRTSSARCGGCRSSCRSRSPRCWRCSIARSSRAAPPRRSCSTAPFALTGGVFALWAGRHAALGERRGRLHRAARPGVARSACCVVSAIEARRRRGRRAARRPWSRAASRSCARC